MSSNTLRALLGLASMLGVVACGGFAFSTASCGGNNGARRDDRTLAQGARLYRTYCALCHGESGEGYDADNANALFNRDFLASVSDGFLTTAIDRGRPGTAMAAYALRRGGPLTEADIAALVAFIRSKQRGPSVELEARPIGTNLDAARPIYADRCAGCHGDRGQGVSALSLDNAVFHESASDAQIRYAIEHGRRGTPMPGFASTLTPAQIDDLVGLIRSFRRRGASALSAAIPEDLPIVINPEGGNADFQRLREGRFVPAAELAEALEHGKRLVILDARPPSEWTQLRIPGAVPCPYYAVDELVERLPRDEDTWIVAYCGCPHAASGRVMDELRRRGFLRTVVLDEGIFVWRDLGHPVVGTSLDESEEEDGSE